MKRDARVYLQDILESIEAIEEYTNGFSEDDFIESRQVQDAVARRLEIIGEAVKNLGDDVKGRHPNVPWREIAGMRDILIHAYFGLNVRRLWNVVEDDLPKLKKQMRALLKKTSKHKTPSQTKPRRIQKNTL